MPRPFAWEKSVLNNGTDSSGIGQFLENPFLETPRKPSLQAEYFSFPKIKVRKKNSTVNSGKRANSLKTPMEVTCPFLPAGLPEPGGRIHPKEAQCGLCLGPSFAHCQYVNIALMATPEVPLGPGHGDEPFVIWVLAL